jgi:hypothetical protein
MNKENKLSTSLALILLIPPIKFIIVQTIPGLSIYNDFANLLISFLLLFFISSSFFHSFLKNPKFSIISFLFFSNLFLTTLVFFPENIANISSHFFKSFSLSFVSLILAYSLTDFDLFLTKLLIVSKIIIVGGFIMTIFTGYFGLVGISASEYNMSLSYYILVPVLVSLDSFLRHSDKSSFIYFLLGLAVIILVGARGPILSLLLFLVVFFIDNLSRNTLNKRFLMLSFIIIILFIFITPIATQLVEITSYLGLSSRTLNSIVRGSITNLSNRDIIAEGLYALLLKSPISGVGFLGDLRSHNIILENLMFYGLPFGLLINFFLFLFIFYTVFINKGGLNRRLLLIFFSYAIIDALLNLTIWGKDIFWIYLGLGLSTLIKTNKNQTYEKIKQLNA